MNWKGFLVISLLSAAVLGVIAAFQAAPGYMDAEYYYGMGLRIANLGEFSEPFIWNYLIGVEAIPHPGFTYWMPLPALVAAFGMWISGILSFSAAKIGMIAVAALVPAVVMGITYRLTKDQLSAWLAGLLAIFPAFYSIFLTTTDSFGIMMLLGGIYLLTALGEESWRSFLVLGILTGLLHLTRAEGMLWFAGGFLLVWKTRLGKVRMAAWLIAGYLLIMGPWFIRNLMAVGEMLPGASSRVLWLREYDELFLLNSKDLTIAYWLSQGPRQILANIGSALWANIKTLVFVQGQLVLFPLILFGLKVNWKNAAIRALVWTWGLIFLLMSAVFPFAGMRGGYLHAGAGLQPLFWMLAVTGFMELIRVAAEKRDWKPKKAEALFGVGLLVILMLGSGFLYKGRVVGPDPENPLWNASDLTAREVDQTLQDLDLEGLVMINNPPGFYVSTGRSSIVIPSGGISEVLQAAKLFSVEVIVLEPNHPASLDSIYQDPSKAQGLEFLTSNDGIRYFKVTEDGS